MTHEPSAAWLAGQGHLDTLQLRSAGGARADIYRYGAHLTSWRTAAGQEWLFVSEAARFREGAAIRGGVPLIFPQFNALGPGPRHGFARNRNWQLAESPQSGDGSRCVFALTDSEETRTLWPHAFRAEFTPQLDDNRLRMTLSVHNTGTTPFQFTAALHTYFALRDFPQAQLHGLANRTYWDNDGSPFEQRQVWSSPTLTFADAIDRVFFGGTEPLLLQDGDRRLRIASEGFEDCVVWNPGAEGARALADMADGEYRRMLCVEAAAIDRPIQLAPGERWQGSQILTAEY